MSGNGGGDDDVTERVGGEVKNWDKSYFLTRETVADSRSYNLLGKDAPIRFQSSMPTWRENWVYNNNNNNHLHPGKKKASRSVKI